MTLRLIGLSLLFSAANALFVLTLPRELVGFFVYASLVPFGYLVFREHAREDRETVE